MDKRKRIAVLVGQPEENYQKMFIEGFLEQAFSYQYDVCIFAMYQKFQESTAREIGESTIFNLIPYESFDGAVVLLDTLQTPGVAESVEKELKKRLKGPVLCIDKESQFFETIMTDHYSSVKKLVSHLIEEHGYKDIAYLTGKKWHIHSKQRLQAYIDCMEEHGLPVSEDRIFYGDFWYTSGEAMVEKVLKDRKGLPRAIACANDCMAIGVAKALSENGVRIPEDVAVVGYDAIEEGRLSPKPITSAPIPSRECGKHIAICLDAIFSNRPTPKFQADIELFIGDSCGCCNTMVPKLNLREQWDTDISECSFYSCFNHMMEDMLSKSEFTDLMNTIFSYVYQIRDFDSFHIFLNSQWSDSDALVSKEAQWHNYTDEMLYVLKCGKRDEGQDRVDFGEMYETRLLLPDLYEDRAEPKAFFFTPLHFEERCLGYAVISYGNEAKCYDDTYRLWLRSATQGLECFRRIEALQQSNKLIQSTQIRDSLTGVYNYNGLLQQIEGYFNVSDENYMSAIAVDIKELSGINEKYGRSAGNMAIEQVAQLLSKSVENGYCCRLGNGEFVGIVTSLKRDEQKIMDIKNALLEGLEKLDSLTFQLGIYTGWETGEVTNREDFEHLVNAAVGHKNTNKLNERKLQNNDNLTEEELKEVAVVQAILDENQFLYHFQPIVNAKNGEIYAYEALMRADVTPFISPLKILKYAEHLQRLYDVEKLTFFNVLRYVEENESLFSGKKVFINSIPGNRLQGADAQQLEREFAKHSGTAVVELTEQAEIQDDELSDMKDSYAKMGIETAVDDYGTGYSNVTNLLRYMPNYVKIDRMLLSGIQDSPQKRHFVREIIEFAHDNDIQALAEGVETAEELETVIRLGVDLIQGYYTARPAKEVLGEIPSHIKSEIVRYQQKKLDSKNQKVYVAGKESRISLAKLVADKYASIEIVNEKTTYRDVKISGVPGLASQIDVVIKDGYQGRITLDGAILTGKRNKAAIDIGENCEVTLVLQGDSQFMDGGIRVPATSKLILEGAGNLTIHENINGYFGIGNDMDAVHGIIEFQQDGCIEINGNGLRGIGIGSGLGGEISVQKGKYILNLTGEEGVGVGTYSGDANLVISACDMSINMETNSGVGIGSVKGNVNVHILHVLIKGFFGGIKWIGIGTMEGERNKVTIIHANVNIDMRAQTLCGIGSQTGETEIEMQYASLLIKGEGKKALALGNQKCTGKIRILNSDVRTMLKSGLHTDIGADVSDIYIANGRCQFTLNGEEIVRWAESADL